MQRAAEPGELGDRAAAQVGDELLGLGAGLIGVVEPVEVHQVLGDGPGQGDLAVWVSGDQASLQPTSSLHREPVATAAQHPTNAEERITSAPAVAESLLLHPPAHVVHANQAQVESDRGAVPVFRPVRFPGPAPRTGRAASTASGSPRVRAEWGQMALVVKPFHGVGIAVPR